MLKLIINADDLGGFQETNNDVFNLMQKQKISSSTILANGPYFEQAIHIAKQFPQYSFGAHLNLSQFTPLIQSDIFRKCGLLDAQQNFRFKKFIIPTSALIEAIKLEWQAQLAKIIDSGINISHIDSHQHMHTRIWMYPILKFLCEKFNLGKMRSKYAVKNLSLRGNFLRRLVRQWKSFPAHYIMKKLLNQKTPDHFSDIHSGLNFLSQNTPQKDYIIELMCHPGVPNFEQDYPLLSGNYEQRIKADYQLISYNDF